MGYYKKLEVDLDEIKRIKAECVFNRQLIAVIMNGLAAIDERQKKAVQALNILEYRISYAEEVDPCEN